MSLLLLGRYSRRNAAPADSLPDDLLARMSALNASLPFLSLLPPPGTDATDARAFLAGMYVRPEA